MCEVFEIFAIKFITENMFDSLVFFTMLEDAENQCHIRIVLAVIFSFESNNVLNIRILSATTSVHYAKVKVFCM